MKVCLDDVGEVCFIRCMENIKAEFRAAVIAIIDGLFEPELSHVLKHVQYYLESEFSELLCVEWQLSEIEKIWKEVM